MTEQELPEYLFAVHTPDGKMLGHVAYAKGFFEGDDAARYAEVVTREHFMSLMSLASRTEALVVRSLPVEQMVAISTPSSQDCVLIDTLYMNDCCALAVGELPLASHMQDAEVTCKSCRSMFRYMYDTKRQAFVWRWSTPSTSHEMRRAENVMRLSATLALITAHNAESEDVEPEDETLSKSPTWGPWGEAGRPDSGA